MSTNRLLLFCPCCTSKARVRDRLLSVRETVKSVEVDAGGIIETIVPSMRSHREGRRQLRFYLTAEIAPVALSGDVRSHVASELRRLGNELCQAALAVEGGQHA